MNGRECRLVRGTWLLEMGEMRKPSSDPVDVDDLVSSFSFSRSVCVCVCHCARARACVSVCLGAIFMTVG